MEKLKRSGLTSKERKWLKIYFETMNATEAARAAYDCKNGHSAGMIGYKNMKKLKPLIKEWLEEMGFSEEALRMRLLRAMDAKEKKAFCFEGNIIYSEEMPQWRTRVRALDIATKIKGMQKERHEYTGSVDYVHRYSEEELEAARRAVKVVAQMIREKKLKTKEIT